MLDQRRSVSDLLTGVGPLVLRPHPASSVQPPPPNQVPSPPYRRSGPALSAAHRDPTTARQSPPQPPRSCAYIIHGGTNQFHHAVAANATACRSKNKGKKSLSGPTGTKVTTLFEDTVARSPRPITSAARRSFAPRNMPSPHPKHDLILITWSNMSAALLKDANCCRPLSFYVFVNDHVAVSLTTIETVVLTASYAPFFDAITLHLNQSLRIGKNP